MVKISGDNHYLEENQVCKSVYDCIAKNSICYKFWLIILKAWSEEQSFSSCYFQMWPISFQCITCKRVTEYIFSGLITSYFDKLMHMSLSINVLFPPSYFNIFLCQDYFHHALTTFLLLCKGKITLWPERRIKSSHSTAFLPVVWYNIIWMFHSYYVNYLYT